jgi:hypothetical protein
MITPSVKTVQEEKEPQPSYPDWGSIVLNYKFLGIII